MEAPTNYVGTELWDSQRYTHAAVGVTVTLVNGKEHVYVNVANSDADMDTNDWKLLHQYKIDGGALLVSLQDKATGSIQVVRSYGPTAWSTVTGRRIGG